MKKKKAKNNDMMAGFGHDSEMFEKAVQEFCNEAPRLMKALSSACDNENWSEVYRIAHRIYDCATDFQNTAVCEISKQIEVLSQRNQTAGLHALTKHLESQTKEMMKTLSSMCATSGKKAA